MNPVEPLMIAIPKGRMYEETVKLLRRAGAAGPELEDQESRSLTIACPEQGTCFLIARDSDVPTYVEYGAADLGIAGKNVLMEGEPRVYELLDLGYSVCRFVLAAPAGADAASLFNGSVPRRVATKYPRLTESYFRGKGIQVETIHLHGSIEVAPKVGLADMIVDIAETGRTLRENNLAVIEELWTSSARLIANRASYRLKTERIRPLVEKLRALTSGLASVSTLAPASAWVSKEEQSQC